MNYKDEIGSLSGKTREEVVKMLWRGMNSAVPGQGSKIARKVADYIIQHTVMENIYSDSIVKTHTDNDKGHEYIAERFLEFMSNL